MPEKKPKPKKPYSCFHKTKYKILQRDLICITEPIYSSDSEKSNAYLVHFVNAVVSDARL